MKFVGILPFTTQEDEYIQVHKKWNKIVNTIT